MESLNCRLFSWTVADGATNMAVDEVLVRTAAETGTAALRFYGWSLPTLSLGYFQPAAVRLSDSRLAALPYVRRPSGGATLVHDQEVTYALAVPPGPAWHAGGPWMPRMHRIIVAALDALGLAGRVSAVPAAGAARHGDVLCFQQFTPGDLLCSGSKVVGSAQRKVARALMQHGSLLLARSEHAPALPGLAELTGTRLAAETVRQAVVDAFAWETGWAMIPARWTPEELGAIAALVREKYGTSAWNERR